MSELAKSSRTAMKEKIKRLVTADPHQKVDSSTWTPPEELDTEAKTGARPLVRRIYKSGGKVEGMASKKRSDRMARKSGGRTAPWVDDLINRDVRTANEAREGKKHVGAFKRGGRAKKMDGGSLSPEQMAMIKQGIDPFGGDRISGLIASAPMPNRASPVRSQPRPARVPMPPRRPGSSIANDNMNAMGPMTRKKGGKVSEMEWEHSKEDLKQDKKLAKKHGMSLEKWEKSALDKKHDKNQSAEGLCYGGKAKKADGGKIGWLKGAKGKEVFSGNSTTKIPGVVGGRKARLYGGRAPETEANSVFRDIVLSGGKKSGGRTAHAKGGKTKGKTNISININPQAPNMPMPMPPMGMKPPMPPMTPPMAPPPGGPAPGGAPDPALLAAIAGGMKGGAGAPPMPMPMPRKSVGRTIHVINHAAGGGLGRLEKIKAYGEPQKRIK
jgi:hypothetical protein